MTAVRACVPRAQLVSCSDDCELRLWALVEVRPQKVRPQNLSTYLSLGRDDGIALIGNIVNPVTVKCPLTITLYIKVYPFIPTLTDEA